LRNYEKKISRVRLKKLTKKQSYSEGLRRIQRLRGSLPETQPDALEILYVERRRDGALGR
jgi:hypothetical protein